MISTEQTPQLRQCFLRKFNVDSSYYDFNHNFINNINWLKIYLIASIEMIFISIQTITLNIINDWKINLKSNFYNSNMFEL
jgi:hypothetical protein